MDSGEKINTEQKKTPKTFYEKAVDVLKESISWLLVLVSALLASIILTEFVFMKALVPSTSMENTINKNDRILGLRLFGEIQRGDILIFEAKEYSGVDELYVKRCIGLPGDTVEIKEGKVYINGKKLTEDYLKEAATGDFGPYEVPEGCYFFLGDNRNASRDARYWTQNRYVKRKDIIAKVVLRIGPSFKVFMRPDYE